MRLVDFSLLVAVGLGAQLTANAAPPRYEVLPTEVYHQTNNPAMYRYFATLFDNVGDAVWACIAEVRVGGPMQAHCTKDNDYSSVTAHTKSVMAQEFVPLPNALSSEGAGVWQLNEAAGDMQFCVVNSIRKVPHCVVVVK